MFDDPESPGPSERALVALAPPDPEWHPILHLSNQVVLYNPTSHALAIRTHSRPSTPTPTLARRTHGARCPYCHRSYDYDYEDGEEGEEHPASRAANYFHLLEIANESSRPASPAGSESESRGTAFRADNMAEGYFKAFFQEVHRLGMGANGSVFLCQHVLDGNALGFFAVKKIAVGQSHEQLVKTLEEVRLLEKLRHPNIVSYQHSWLESCQFSQFGPRVPTLHVLMQWAEGGSLDDFIDVRLGKGGPELPHLRSSGPSHEPASPGQPMSRGARIRAFRALQRAPPEDRDRLRREMGMTNEGDNRAGRKPADWKPVHLMSAEEVRALFGDVVAGLAFLHEKKVLHLDLKPGNVLLTWDEGGLIPRAMLSDFGTSKDMFHARTRSGNTGTLEYAAPETLPVPTTGRLRLIDSKADMWSLGMLLHKLLFFRLPYRYASDGTDASSVRGNGKEYVDRLEREIFDYPGFKPSASLATTFESRRLPPAYLLLLETLLHILPTSRPSCERVLGALREGRLNPLDRAPLSGAGASLVPVLRRAERSRERPVRDPDLISTTASTLEEIVDDDAVAPRVRGRNEKTGLLSPPHRPPSPTQNAGGWTYEDRWFGRRVAIHLPRTVPIRTLKSCVLVLKVMTLARCTHAPVLSTVALGLAVMDTWFESLGATVAFGLAHAALVYAAGSWRGY